ncbi:hypothetical protein I7I50_06268 [Histoplasma capsulatum G186AR]|uniref:Uncharacterized protein n=1 Tax=Ajellomyces capsulatus TaxID=5037 RepID=A0A8H7Z2P5_AJECA|nr:hypothetical protein I7I52_10659 [Histoplasma capsulatum]QSS67251.1 hypothetical protein I7I50_06268 [Histoplasma capsulatum G186AR]
MKYRVLVLYAHPKKEGRGEWIEGLKMKTLNLPYRCTALGQVIMIRREEDYEANGETQQTSWIHARLSSSNKHQKNPLQSTKEQKPGNACTLCFKPGEFLFSPIIFIRG